MKYSGFIIAVLAIGLVACSQKPPKPVIDNFNSKFTGATKVKWDREEENEWEAEFIMNDKELSASFDIAGTWLETEKEIKETELPPAVTNVVNSKYSEYKVEEVAEMQKTGFSGYEIELLKGETKIELQILPDGTINNIKRTISSEEDEN